MIKPLALLSISLLITSSSAQFFDQFFNNNNPFGQQQQQAPSPPNYNDLFSSLKCSTFVCPTLQCVNSPLDCPCNSVNDVKCMTEDSFVCARSCDAVQKALKIGN